mmetsp:Transcript_20172/g.22437  ORF Transcript_20172/g.22437 Transcript_20172/m.22437 type:complete len:416 (-) Transcript_20172:21-1268(-)
MSRRVSPYPMVPVDEALATVLAEASPLQTVEMSLEESLGSLLAAPVIAKEPLPPFRASIKDGYAVVADDGAGDYPVVQTVTAGDVPDFELKKGQICKIMTGAAVPEGATGVVMVENTLLKDDGTVEICKAVSTGTDIRQIGSDIQKGQTVLEKGERLGPAEIGLLATVGAAKVSVFKTPVIALISTGDELLEPHEPLKPGKIRDSNRSMLKALIAAVNPKIEVLDLGVARDTQGELEQKVKRGLEQADIVISSGGVSMGDLDLLKPLLEAEGKVHFGRVLMKPGKPTTFATVTINDKKRLVFALPGNPVSSYVAFCLFGIPAIKRMSGYTNANLPCVQAKLAQRLKLDPVRPEYHRVSLSWDFKDSCFTATTTGSQASSRLLSMRTANALCLLPKQSGFYEKGQIVTAYLIGEMV